MHKFSIDGVWSFQPFFMFLTLKFKSRYDSKIRLVSNALVSSVDMKAWVFRPFEIFVHDFFYIYWLIDISCFFCSPLIINIFLYIQVWLPRVARMPLHLILMSPTMWQRSLRPLLLANNKVRPMEWRAQSPQIHWHSSLAVPPDPLHPRPPRPKHRVFPKGGTFEAVLEEKLKGKLFSQPMFMLLYVESFCFLERFSLL